MPANSRKPTNRVETLRQPVEKIWLAGLGALALTEEEGTRLFKSLVRRGQGFEKDTRALLDRAVETTKAAPGEMVTRLEHGVTETITGVLRRIGVPTRREISALTRRVEGLATTLEKKPVRRRGARKTTTRRARTSASEPTSAA